MSTRSGTSRRQASLSTGSRPRVVPLIARVSDCRCKHPRSGRSRGPGSGDRSSRSSEPIRSNISTSSCGHVAFRFRSRELLTRTSLFPQSVARASYAICAPSAFGPSDQSKMAGRTILAIAPGDPCGQGGERSPLGSCSVECATWHVHHAALFLRHFERRYPDRLRIARRRPATGHGAWIHR